MNTAIDTFVDDCTDHILLAYADAKGSWLAGEDSARAAVAAETKYEECALKVEDAMARAADAEGVRNGLLDDIDQRD